ncbi:MAG: hypothetical protein ABI968_03060 [Acidobacteriota bacterium]
MRLFLWGLAVAAAGPLWAQPFDPALFSGLRWRMIGPFRGGRVLTVAGVPGEPERFFFGSVGGGVWRSDNAGRTWEPVFDGQPIASIGAIAVAPSDPRVLYAGSGEADMRSDISYGNGVYKSVDGGSTWRRIGLEDSRQIGKILIDPKDPDRVFVAALGHAYGPNPERGVFRSPDGGVTWSRVLFRDDNTGAIDLAIDPRDARVILAAMWQTRRPPWNVYPPSNGPGSGLYRSTDGGDTWKAVSGSGLPSEGLGRIRIAFAPSRPGRVYALVDAKEGGLFASEDGGNRWERRSSDRRIWERGWYFAGVTVDPKNADIVYACDTAMYRSTDGGRTFLPFKGAPGGDDYHQLWIDPGDSRRMIFASDQGAAVSVDGGKTWSSWYNQPTAQFYHVATDDRFPYWIYGAQQDSGAAATPSRADAGSLTQRDWRPIAAGGENGYIAPDPAHPEILFGGSVGRFDWRTLQEQNVDPTLAYPGDYRSEWTLPLTFSPRDANALYYANQFLFKTTDAGRHWERISPDLTRETTETPANLDSITARDSAVKGPRRGVIYAIAPSALRDGMLWCGTDDGLIWLTRDDGRHWENVTPDGLSAWSKIGVIEPSHFEPETAFAAVDRHRLDDLGAYVLRTRDGGKTWTSIARGIPAGSYVNVVREDPARRGLLYAGTETGVFVSFDDGDHWQSLQANLPNCSVRDISVRQGDLVIATHGRAFWVLDDLAPLRQLDAKVAGEPVWLFAPAPAIRLNPAPFQGTPDPKDEPIAANPPEGAIIDYVLRTAPSSPVAMEIRDAKGEVVRRFSSEDRVESPDSQRIQTTPDWVAVSQPLPTAAGMHRVLWDLHYAPPRAIQRAARHRSSERGVWAPPGRYTVRLSEGGRTLTQPLVVSRDPRIGASDADLVAQFELARRIDAERARLAESLRQAQALRRQIEGRRGQSAGEGASALQTFAGKLETVAGPGLDSEEYFDEGEADATNLRRLYEVLARFRRTVESADAAPTPDALTGFEQRRKAAGLGETRWADFLRSEVPILNKRLNAAGLPPISIDETDRDGSTPHQSR